MNNEAFNFLTSKGFWISIVVLYLIWLAYSMGKSDNHVWTQEEEQSAIGECQRSGGQVVYGGDGKYYDCAINGRIE